MASIKSLLNPIVPASRECSPTPTSLSPATMTSRSPRQKRQKVVKDQPSFKKANTRGDLRYPPHEERDEELERIHTQFQLHPLRDIANFPAHIPYCSQKKSFKGRTGRGSLEVFHYTFQIPNGDGKKWVVSWDYNIGLVRTTSLFKCTQHPKTAPAKALKMNPGLSKISHSITGGALIGQGYWMPFEAAKALAATFCWRIRYVLTPLFGLDFPSRCIPPEDSRYGDMRIDPAIILQATREAAYYRGLELAASPRPQDIEGDRQNIIFRPAPPQSGSLQPKSHAEQKASCHTQLSRKVHSTNSTRG
ncbi:putative APSES transcription factor Xbp1 [Aspergillus ibericus CBS 121593]|uniref:DNA-binding domain of Mlu1-box binding protein MBP1 n=1 Tax=Aspergillus ibericus CBS 121593 TaxID=1448316 RepID=A0A395H7N5_9EURO|nr:DNA-binding domain of Mlu1-box binding protein MBP1 [Aspergillus ibericus CBS 121593]RAL03927.1 DNA-binding domain of Mlu1-box binding protein MBP1 [Aspergillus ibericus CBS 121593]